MSFLTDEKTDDSKRFHSLPLTRSPWKSSEMPWSYAGPSIDLMKFNAVPTTSFNGLQIVPTDQFTTQCTQVKRKMENDNFVPCKQLITEEKMAQHLNGLHISNDFVSHQLNPKLSVDEVEMNVNMTPEEVRERLKCAQRITVMEEVRKLAKADEIIPKILLDKNESPSKALALVLWKPPNKPENLRQLLTTYNCNNNLSKAKSDSNKKSEKDNPSSTDFEEIEVEFEETNEPIINNNNNNNFYMDYEFLE